MPAPRLPGRRRWQLRATRRAAPPSHASATHGECSAMAPKACLNAAGDSSLTSSSVILVRSVKRRHDRRHGKRSCPGLPLPPARQGHLRLMAIEPRLIAAACRRCPSRTSSCRGACRRRGARRPCTTSVPSCLVIGPLKGCSLPDLIAASVSSAIFFTSSGMLVKGAIVHHALVEAVPGRRSTSRCRRAPP